MGAVNITFKSLYNGYSIPPVYTEVKGSCLIFTINIEDFQRKIRDVDGGHTVDAPATLTYSSVVLRETV